MSAPREWFLFAPIIVSINATYQYLIIMWIYIYHLISWKAHVLKPPPLSFSMASFIMTPLFGDPLFVNTPAPLFFLFGTHLGSFPILPLHVHFILIGKMHPLAPLIWTISEIIIAWHHFISMLVFVNTLISLHNFTIMFYTENRVWPYQAINQINLITTFQCYL